MLFPFFCQKNRAIACPVFHFFVFSRPLALERLFWQKNTDSDVSSKSVDCNGIEAEHPLRCKAWQKLHAPDDWERQLAVDKDKMQNQISHRVARKRFYQGFSDDWLPGLPGWRRRGHLNRTSHRVARKRFYQGFPDDWLPGLPGWWRRGHLNRISHRVARKRFYRSFPDDWLPGLPGWWRRGGSNP